MPKISDVTGVMLTAPRGKSETNQVNVGKIHHALFAPSGTKLVGFLVSRPPTAGIIRHEDLFVALDGLTIRGDRLCLTRSDATGDAARKRLGLIGEVWDACIVWVGMDVITKDGRELGFVTDASFDAKTGKVHSFFVGDGSAAQKLVGTLEIPSTLVSGYKDGHMVVANDAATGQLSGGVAARAGAAFGRVQAEGGKLAAQVGKTAGKAADRAADKGGHALGRQLGRTKGMFGAFLDEYKKASK